jgi:hypothetical protein
MRVPRGLNLLWLLLLLLPLPLLQQRRLARR